MPVVSPGQERRSDALSKERIVAAATEILDAEGEAALTFRSLAAALRTGPGAIYHHVTGKAELLEAVTGDLIGAALARAPRDEPARETIRTIALAVFDTIDAHPWVGAHLAREPWQPALLHLLERLGQQVQSMGVSADALFNSTTALQGYILGTAGQNAANARRAPEAPGRSAVLGSVASDWLRLDAAEYPFLHLIAAGFPHHDDREQFLAGVDLIIAGIDAVR